MNCAEINNFITQQYQGNNNNWRYYNTVDDISLSGHSFHDRALSALSGHKEGTLDQLLTSLDYNIIRAPDSAAVSH